MQNSQTPKNFFIQAGIFVSLYVSAISFLVFLFSIINDAFPSSTIYYGDDNAGIRFSISTLIVVFPLFVFLSRVYRNFVMTNPEIKESKLRKWATYFTLFITGVTMAVDAVVLVNTFLGGEDLALGFMLKILAVFVVAGGVFFFCFKDLKGYFDINPKQSKVWLTIISSLLFISIVLGFMVIGSPSTQRSKMYDARRVSDLQSVQWQVVSYYQSKGQTPNALVDLNDSINGFIAPNDPVTNVPYTYIKISPTKFNLCAEFETVSNETEKGFEFYDGNWNHDKGYACFEKTIDPERYPLTQIKN